ncbi:MAG TPA: polysaccharide biosynthesis/export family protein [candidate division Zixibacteria bacterium]|nr:polysaccharide biosynthesis/export family protein [candidate division Zixibacteria bacterium]MDM7971652.1 polysaccharide biosynthesis/export family protein [candidate division Zixibacteria bacterium]HOD65828.1 polysaccharide biosynthesis/export family protein [candidate division Zixibacteria bacterium]HOZ07920.1 polysaccharide biosynthesis/export family protein [candidate division Zixibacteria bacterium]HPI33623.1 polysaccharide biosynthesis/export family protein [candidate division Zixibact
MNTRLLLLSSLLVLTACGIGSGQEYRIGPGDVLEIEFWQDPTLNSTLRVSFDGTITLDIIGEIKASGRTTQELQEDIVRQMSRLNQRISQAVVRVQEYNYLYVFVSGQANHPGKMTFEEIPDLWTIINEAGGVTETGDLSRVTIIRGGEEAGRVEVVNVAAAIAAGQLGGLPKIRRGDTIDIPRTPVGLPSASFDRSAERKNLVYVVGAVTTPGPVEYQPNIDVLEAVALAGGPTNEANVKKARVVCKDEFYGQALEIDLERYSRSGAPARYVLGREDVVVVPHKSGFFQGFNVTTVATLAGVITTSILVYDQLRRDD